MASVSQSVRILIVVVGNEPNAFQILKH